MNKVTFATSLGLLFAAGILYGQRPLTLRESFHLALENNAGLRNNWLEVEAAQHTQIAAASRYLPDVSAGALAFDASRALFEMKTPGGDLLVYDGNPLNLLNPSQYAFFPGGTTSLLAKGRIGYLDIIQPLYAGGRIRNSNRLAGLGVEATGDNLQLERDAALLETEEQYWRLVTLDEKRLTVARYETLLISLNHQVEKAFSSGLVLRNDLMKVRLQLGQIALDKASLENSRKLALMAFCQHMGIPYDSTLQLITPLPEAADPGLSYLPPREVLKQWREYALLLKSVRAEELQTRLKRREYLPQLGIGARTMVVKLDAGEKRTLGVLFGSLSVPLSRWIGGAAELEERTLREEIASNNLCEKSELLLLEIKKIWQEYGDAFRQVRLSEQMQLQAEENLRINLMSHDNGFTTLNDLLEAQALRQRAIDGSHRCPRQLCGPAQPLSAGYRPAGVRAVDRTPRVDAPPASPRGTGTYLCVLSVNGFTSSKRMTLPK